MSTNSVVVDLAQVAEIWINTARTHESGRDDYADTVSVTHEATNEGKPRVVRISAKRDGSPYWAEITQDTAESSSCRWHERVWSHDGSSVALRAVSLLTEADIRAEAALFFSLKTPPYPAGGTIQAQKTSVFYGPRPWKPLRGAPGSFEVGEQPTMTQEEWRAYQSAYQQLPRPVRNCHWILIETEASDA